MLGLKSLRKMAEKALALNGDYKAVRTDSELRDLVHELQAHRIELEMQNEELRNAQVELEESRTRYSDLYDFSPVGYVTLDKNSMIIEANLTLASEMLFVERGGLVKTPFNRYFNRDDKQILFQFIRSLQEEDAPQTCEVSLKGGRGVEFHARLDGIQVEDGNLRVSIVDITERGRAEEQLKVAQNPKLHSILDNSTTVIYVKDPDGRYSFVNHRYERLFYITEDKIKGRTDYEIFPKELADVFRANDLKVIEANGPLEFEEIVPHGDGPHTYISVKFPLYSVSGDIEAVCSISTDITDRTKVEEERLKAQKLESVGLLAGGIAHDFNNLLTGIMGNLSLMSDLIIKETKGQNGDLNRRLIETEKATMRAGELTKQLLIFSKGGSPVKETIPIGTLIQESICFALRGSNVSPKFHIPDDLWSVEADKGQLAQVINNLSINATQAMPDGGVLTVSAENCNDSIINNRPPKDGKYLKVSVSDQGSGIPKNLLQKIFDPYFTTKQEGSGLGLASAYSVVNKHGGSIDVSSEPGEGTTFDIYLPASKKKVAVKETAEKKVILSMESKVLIMDDEEIVRDVAVAMLANLGYEVVIAKDGSEAIDLYKESSEAGKPFNLVIVDLTVPGGMGGKEAATRLFEFDPSAKIMVSSGYSNDPVMADFKKYGFCGVLSKPYNTNKLGIAVQQALKAKER